jgi:hypothetical protein
LTEGPPAAESTLRKIPTRLLSAAEREAISREVQLIAANSTEPIRCQIECPTVSTPPYLDGVLDDEVWRTLAQADQMIRLSPQSTSNPNGADHRQPAPRAATDPMLGQTQVMLAHDDEYLYVAAICHRSAPQTPRGSATQSSRRKRDQLGDEPDQFHFALDLDRDCRTSYGFAVDALGSFADQIGEDRLWNPTWYLAHASSELNWIVEAAIPLDQLGPKPGTTTEAAWGLSVRRRLADGTIESWSPLGAGPHKPLLDTQLTKPRFAPFDGAIFFR